MIAVLAIGVLALSSALTIAAGSISELAKNQNTTSGNETFYTAESALLEGAYQYIQAVISDTTYAGGNGELLNNTDESAITVDDTNWPYAIVRGESENNTTTRGVTRRITVFPEGLAFNYAVYGQQNVSVGGNATINGNMFANDSIAFSGSSELNGDAATAGTISGEDNITGDAITDVEQIPPPGIDEAPYLEAANNGGTYFANANDAKIYLNNEIRGSAETPVVVFVADLGETKIQNASTTGSLYVKGDLQLTSGGNYTASSSYAAIVVEGDLSIAGGVTINGIVYVKGSTSFGGGTNTINGSLISVGSISSLDLTGNTVINYASWNWQDLAGLETESTETPRLLEWGEE